MSVFKKYEFDVRPWGSYERFTLNEPSTVKIITIKANEAFSLQTHSHRDERWKVISGSGIVEIDSLEKMAEAGDEFIVTRQSKHRATAGKEGLVFLEISTGEFDERDIKRFEDRYGRV